MTTTDKLSPLAPRFRRICTGYTMSSIHSANPDRQNYCDGYSRAMNEASTMAAPYDALIRQQEARIAELEAELAKFRELAREAKVVLDGIDYGSMAGLTLERWVQRLAALHKEE